jgi:hypothetical protein
MKNNSYKNIFIKKEFFSFLLMIWNERVLIFFIIIFFACISFFKLFYISKQPKMFAEINKTAFSVYRPYIYYYYENDLLIKKIDKNLIYLTLSDYNIYLELIENNFLSDFEFKLRSRDQFISFLKQSDDYQKILINKNVDPKKYYKNFKIEKVNYPNKILKYQITYPKEMNYPYLYSHYIKFIYKQVIEKHNLEFKKIISNVKISYENELEYNKKIITEYINEKKGNDKITIISNKIYLLEKQIRSVEKNFFLLNSNKFIENFKFDIYMVKIPLNINFLDILRLLTISFLTSLIVIVLKKNIKKIFSNFFKISKIKK